ncbi:ArsC family reductase [Pseudorhodoferax sp. Leaf267]|uniref:ArsC family reductase n=1 Tax=Pseudorhodoferax sp. Leaf267 TaxID=1736316 RepID=UPI0006F2DED7|nr:ArsC family reductase [Pseudorhodoferax sp. Leaf267]KQP18069.1 ArsC family transcriptional regulator [Pseudorhodoferax sp. Leaf267]
MITMYGIANCDTVKKARNWLAEHGVDHAFHDFKKSGVPPVLDDWIAQAGWEALLNRKGTTWRKLPPDDQAGVTDAASAAALMRAQPSVIKRPVVDWNGRQLTVGFAPDTWAGLRD